MENNITEIESGERLSFFKLFSEKGYHIEIPIIQRDYAQGRDSSSEVRKDFIDALYDYLEENKPNRDLDFVYGNINNINGLHIFIPLDGQQRLTTLFLLHWYLAISSNNVGMLREFIAIKEIEDNNEVFKSKFTYETRTSSKEFCDALISNDIKLSELIKSDEGRNNSLSKTIQNCGWFYLSWNNDPTIQSMLFMLDAIHIKFADKNDFFNRLIEIENPIITFLFLNLKEFKLTDDLYIKMNARGVPLTTFENFKAKLEKYMNKPEFKNESYNLDFVGTFMQVDIKKYFSHKIDTDWANLFWNHTFTDKRKFDKLIMNFFRAIAINQYASSNNTEYLKFLLDKNNEGISFQQYIKFNCLDKRLIIEIISILDLIKNENNKVKKYLTECIYYNEFETFNTVINNSFVQAGYVERIKFHAYCQYLIKWKTDSGFEDVEGLKDWMRVVYNLTENTAPYNNEKEYISSITAINQLIAQSNDILNYIITLDKINGFDEVQFIEEKIKAHLLLKETNWQKLIYSIEKHGYFKGQIGFVLFLSGIEEYFNTNNHCNWNDHDDENLKTQFIKYRDIALKIFNDKGINTFPDFIWERALLAKGDYLITEGSNQSFLINLDRDISWKRFLKRDKNHVLHSGIIKQLFNELDANNLNTSLKTIKDNYSNTDWRNRFIQTPRLLNYLGAKRYVRKNSSHGFVLFSGERMSGAHAELYSYSFFLDNLEGKEFAPFTSKANYNFAAGDDREERPCAYIGNWEFDNTKYALDILYSYNQNKFKLRFFYRNIGNFRTDLVSVLTNLGFSAINESYVIDIEECEVLKKINDLGVSLKGLTI